MVQLTLSAHLALTTLLLTLLGAVTRVVSFFVADGAHDGWLIRFLNFLLRTGLRHMAEFCHLF